MPSVDLDAAEVLHPDFTHEWWYFFAELSEANTGARYHYTAALMRRGAGWLSYHRWWRLNAHPPVAKKYLQLLGKVQPAGSGIVIRPGADWTAFIAPGEFRHSTAAVDLTFEDDQFGACLHTRAADGGILNYGGANEMAWYSRPWLRVRGRRPGVNDNLQGFGWMEHQWGNTDFTRLRWRYLPILELGSNRRFIAYWYRHEDHLGSGTTAVCELKGGEALPVAGAAMTPTAPGGLTTRIDLGTAGALVCASRPDAAIELSIPLVPDFYEGPSELSGALSGDPVRGLAMTEFHPV